MQQAKSLVDKAHVLHDLPCSTSMEVKMAIWSNIYQSLFSVLQVTLYQWIWFLSVLSCMQPGIVLRGDGHIILNVLRNAVWNGRALENLHDSFLHFIKHPFQPCLPS